MKPRRYENWPILLSAFIKSRITMPFQWGVNDCCIFACDCMLALTGVDPAEGIRGTYDNEHDALRVVYDRGGMEKMFTDIGATIGLTPHTNASRAKRGDIVLFMQNGLETAGIIDDSGKYILGIGTQEYKLEKRDAAEAYLVWSY